MCRIKFRAQILLLALVVSGIGCAANTETASDQRPVANDRTTNEQDQATQGSYIVNHWHVYNDNDPNGTLNNDVVNALTSGTDGVLSGFASTSPTGSSAFKNTRAGHVQHTQITQTITTGGTTPGQTGEASGSAAATGTTTQSATTDQTIKAAVEAAIAAGLNANTQGGNAGVEGTQSQSNQLTADQRAAVMKAISNDPELLRQVLENPKLLDAIFGAMDGGTTEPTTESGGG